LEMPFKAAFMFRPGYIQPMRGIRTKTRIYQALYTGLSWLYPVFEKVMPNQITTTEKHGKAMIAVVDKGHAKKILHAKEINDLAAG